MISNEVKYELTDENNECPPQILVPSPVPENIYQKLNAEKNRKKAGILDLKIIKKGDNWLYNLRI